MSLAIHKVETKNDLRQFIELPYKLYEEDPVWIPPLRIEEKKNYSAAKNPLFNHCTVGHFLLKDNSIPVGRISAFVNHLANDHWQTRTGLFGSYECADIPEGSALLLETASEWLQGQSMQTMQGPWSFASQEFGLLVKGFNTSPMVLAPYNPQYYENHFLRFGLAKTKDLLVYDIDITDGYQLPDRYIKFTDKLMKRMDILIRPIRMKNLDEDVRHILNCANASTSDNWGYIPVTEEEAAELAATLKLIADPDIVLIAEINGKVIGYLIALPDINTLLKNCNGRLLPSALFKLMFKRKSINQYRIWALGVIPEYQRKGIDTLFYRKLCDTLIKKQAARIEANYILEDNMVMNNPILKLGLKEIKRYRVFEKSL